jgi:DNA repair protein RadA/Sms
MRSGPAFRCADCGHRAPKWLGRCPECGAWNTFAEEATTPSGRRAPPAARDAVPFDEIDPQAAPRLRSGISEFDRALGGGVVPGSLVLVGGDPGIGKSTLMLQVASALAGKPAPVLYVSGEESDSQVRQRGDRLGVRSAGLLFLPETRLETILAAADRAQPTALVVDSIQTLSSDDIPSAPGSLSQVREAAARLLIHAKGTGLPIFAVGHVTKDGAIAGPRALEHIVDVVLYLEGERHHSHRILRAVKNRFGPTSEIGIFEMTGAGLAPVADPSRLFLGDEVTRGPGSAVLASVEGSRPLLVEIQALVGDPGVSSGRRVSLGIDAGRVALLVAVLERHCGRSLAGRDLFVNVAGGFELDDPAADLATLAAIASSLEGIPLPPRLAIFGEVGLTGEVRTVGRAAERLQEAARLGFGRAIVPAGNAATAPGGLALSPVPTLTEALAAMFPIPLPVIPAKAGIQSSDRIQRRPGPRLPPG